MEVIESNKFGKLEETDLHEFENDNSLLLPQDYRNFIIEHNGGRPKKKMLLTDSIHTDVYWLYGMQMNEHWASFFYALHVFENRIPNWHIPIGTDSGGNLFIMSLREENYGNIFFWDHELEAENNGGDFFGNITFVANNFSDFENLLQIDE